MTQTRLRFATPQDTPALKELCQQHMQFEKKLPAKPPSEEALARFLFHPSSTVQCLLAESDGDAIGFATFMVQYSTWEAHKYLYLDCLFLREGHRGCGTGLRIMESIRDEAKKHGCVHIEWQTPNFNADAIAFYNRLGATSKSKERFTWSVSQPSELESNKKPSILPPPDSLAEPYRPRPTRMRTVRQCNNWSFKLYQMSLHGSGLAESVVEAAFDCIGNNVVWPTDLEDKYGFVILHEGEQAMWALVHLWVRDILRQFAFFSPLNAPEVFQANPMPGFNACVWELEVTQHERDAWVQHVMSTPQRPNFEAYLNDSFTISLDATKD